MSKLTLTNLNLPNNPTARRLLELIGEYQVRYVLLKDGVRFTSPDLSEAKGQHEKDFVKHFLPELTSSENGNSSSTPDDVWVLEEDSLKEFKDTYKYQLGISLGKINKLTVVGWNTAYHYLVQGHSDTAKDFSNLGADSVAESFNEETQDQSSLTEDPILGMIDSVRGMRLKQLELEKEQRRQAEEQRQQAQKMLEQALEIQQAHQTANEAKAGLEAVHNELSALKEFAIAQPEGLDQDKADLINQAFQQLGAVLEQAGIEVKPKCYQTPWKELGLTMRNSSINYDLNARYANAKKAYKTAHDKWVKNGKPRGQAPKKPSRISILLKDNKVTEAFKAAQQVITSNLAKLT